MLDSRAFTQPQEYTFRDSSLPCELLCVSRERQTFGTVDLPPKARRTGLKRPGLISLCGTGGKHSYIHCPIGQIPQHIFLGEPRPIPCSAIGCCPESFRAASQTSSSDHFPWLTPQRPAQPSLQHNEPPQTRTSADQRRLGLVAVPAGKCCITDLSIDTMTFLVIANDEVPIYKVQCDNACLPLKASTTL